MAKLSLFGSPALKIGGLPRPIPRRKARALLAYLAVTQKSASREALVALLWPEYDRRTGRADLSRMLSVLRRVLGAEYLMADRETVALNAESDLWVDVVHFRSQLEACRAPLMSGPDDACHHKLAAAVDLYQAGFLAGFTLPDCPAFDEWQLLETEALRRDLSWALEKLIHAHEARNDLARAIAYARRWVALDPLHEPAQRRLIALYGGSGQRAAAHRQYQAFERLLAQELGVEPQPETRQLSEGIRLGGFAAAAPPPFAVPEPGTEPQRPFVARTGELAQLNRHLDAALAANGRIVFVTGGAGRGKTSLLEEFARRSQQTHSDLIVAGGSGSAFAGLGDPYLPFREVLGLLTGDFANRRTGGQLTVEQARRLWDLLPLTTQAILDHGPQLLGVLVSGEQLLARAAAAVPAGAAWLVALQTEVARRRTAPGALQQTALFGQFTKTLHHLAQQRPLLITLDDLQWMDEASIALLFHLGRRLAGSRILIAAAYRPDELVQGRDGQPHPLLAVLAELKRTYGDVFIDLAESDRVGGRAFVDALLDTEPNRLDSAFRQALFRQTGGHPLFTVELLREMQSRGHLVQDEVGQWHVGQELHWETFPARVEAVIAGRIDRLDADSRDILAVASVAGDPFTAEVVSRVLGIGDRPLLQVLSRQLAERDRLLRATGEIRAGRRYLSAYRFSHALFQQYLYQKLSPGERRRLHNEVAGALAALYSGDLDLVVVQLARHYAAAEHWEKAAPYWARAGDLAYREASLPDAARHYRSALAHWPQSDEKGRAALLRKLGESLWLLGQHQAAVETLRSSHDLFHALGDNQGAAAAQRLLGRLYWELGEQPEAGAAYRRALALLQGEPQSAEFAWALAALSNYHMHLGDYDESIRLGERALALARDLGAGEIVIQCLCDLGSALSGKGDWDGLALEQESLDLALAANRPHDAGRAYLYISEALMYLGRYQRARETLEDALAYTRRMHVPYVAASAARMLAEVDWLTGRWSAALARLPPLVERQTGDQPAGLSQSYLVVLQARLYNDLGRAQKARQLLRDALAGPIDSLDPRLALLGELARAQAMLDNTAAAASAAAEILEWADQAPHLYPNLAWALLFVCRSPLALGRPEMLGHARSALRQLERLDRQYATPGTAACRLEGQAWLSLAEAHVSAAASSFEQAVAQWRELSHPYDQIRALSGLAQALTLSGHRSQARSAAMQAMGLTDSLAAQLGDPALKTSFLDSMLVQEIRATLVGS